MINKIKQIKNHELLWLHIDEPTEHEIQYLREQYQFHPLDLQDCLSINQRPKVDAYDDYVFLILLFPYYDRTTRKVLSSELDFFIGGHYVITISDGHNKLIDQFFEECLRSQVLREQTITGSASLLLWELLRRLQDGVFPMLDHVSEDITNIEMQIFNGSERRMLREIMLIKQNIVNFRRVMNAHKSTLKKLMDLKKPGVFFLAHEQILYFENILDRTKDIWELLESQKETINALHETNSSLISFKLNDVLKMLTAISVTIFSGTLIATIFAMDVARGMPIVDNPHGFWIVVGLIVAVMTSIGFYFKRKDWL